MIGDVERIDWIEAAAQELKISICYSPTGYYEIWLGQICIPGTSLRQALDLAIQATREKTL